MKPYVVEARILLSGYIASYTFVKGCKICEHGGFCRAGHIYGLYRCPNFSRIHINIIYDLITHDTLNKINVQ